MAKKPDPPFIADYAISLYHRLLINRLPAVQIGMSIHCDRLPLGFTI